MAASVTANAILMLEAQAAASEARGYPRDAELARELIEGLRAGTIYAEPDGNGEYQYGLTEWLRE